MTTPTLLFKYKVPVQSSQHLLHLLPSSPHKIVYYLGNKCPSKAQLFYYIQSKETLTILPPKKSNKVLGDIALVKDKAAM